MTPDTLRLMARFNAWANARLYGVVAGLPPEAYEDPNYQWDYGDDD